MVRYLWIGLILIFAAVPAMCGQVGISRIDMMPNQPAPYLMRNWKQVARDYDAYVFDFTRGRPNADSWWQTYPLTWWDTARYNYPFDTFGMPSYIGTSAQTGGGAHESINVMGAVLGGSLVGIDKSHQYVASTGQYYNFALMEQQYYDKTNGENMVLNYTATQSGQTFWYEVMPPVLFCQLLWKYPNTGDMENIMYAVADRLYNAEYAMGGRSSPWTVPNFTHTAFNFLTMSPVDNGIWKEPDAAAGYAWIEYMAYVKWGASQHITGADWGIQYLLNRSQNPLYEVLLPYGAYTAARMNAEQGRSYDTTKLINWCFNPSTALDARQGWGVIADSPWGGYDCDGLVGSVTDGSGYAFAMNTFHWAAALSPIPRYNQDYARAIGKWMLNAANASRLFYANGLDAAHQSSEDWSYPYDPCSCITYEGLRKTPRMVTKSTSDYSHVYGEVTGTYTNTLVKDGSYQILKELTYGQFDKLEHVWEISFPAGTSHLFRVYGRYVDGGDTDSGFTFSYATSPGGAYTDMFTVNNTGATDQEYNYYGLPSGAAGTIYVRVRDTSPGQRLNDTLYLNCMMIITETDTFSPYAMGDGLMWGIGTDFALYGASHVGVMAAVIETTNVEKILQLDLLATDYYHAPAYPTYLYYNSYATPQAVDVNVGAVPVDIYDTVSQRMLKVNVSGVVSVEIPADSASVAVLAPAGGIVTLDGTKKKINGVVVDYKTNTAYTNCGQIQASPQRLGGDINGDCIVDIVDLQSLAAIWLSPGTALGRADMDHNQVIDFADFSTMSGQWMMDNNP